MRAIREKILPREKLVSILEQMRKSGKRIGLTNGTFDILHSGHVIYLEEAKKKCDVLVVSVNTDSSVKAYKGDARPIVPEADRAIVVAALGSVDYVTFHSERRMKESLESIRPDYYIKGSDYKEEDLTSRDVLAQWNGKLVLIPLVEGKSTTGIIKKIIEAYGSQPISLESEKQAISKAVILDRDGVINEDIEYLHEPEKFRFIQGALEGIKKMHGADYKIVIATTQAGIGLGYFTKEDFFKVNKVMLRGFNDYGIAVSKVYFCPHSVSDNCACRKPRTGLIEMAKLDLNLDLARSWLIGDKASDILAGKNSGCRTILVNTRHAGAVNELSAKPDFIAADLIEAAGIIINNS